MAEIKDWNVSAASNNGTPPDGAPEGMAPSAVNDVIRENMAVLARWLGDTNGALTATGTADAQLLAPNRTVTAYARGDVYAFRPVADNTGACTLNVSSLGAKSIKTPIGTDPLAGALDTSSVATVIYDGTNFVLVSGAGSASFTTLSATGNVTLGDASGDSITVNAGNMTLANDLSINSGTYVFDQTNQRLGVLIATPRVSLQVQGSAMFGDDLGSAGNGDLMVFRGSGVDPLIRLYSSTNDSFIQGGATLKFGTFAGSGTTVDMELDATGNLSLSGGRFQSGDASFTVSAAGTTTHVSGQFSAGSYILDFRVAGLNMDIKLTAILHVSNNLTPAFSVLQTSDFNVGSVALQCQDNVAQFGFDNTRERKIQFVCTGDGSADRTAVYRWVKIND